MILKGEATMPEAVRLSDRLLTNISTYDQANEDYRVYIQDHKSLIIKNSTLASITLEEMEQYRYIPAMYLKEVHEIDRKYLWIFLYINDIIYVTDFNDLISTVRIPDIEYIDNLLSIFKAVSAAGKLR